MALLTLLLVGKSSIIRGFNGESFLEGICPTICIGVCSKIFNFADDSRSPTRISYFDHGEVCIQDFLAKTNVFFVVYAVTGRPAYFYCLADRNSFWAVEAYCQNIPSSSSSAVFILANKIDAAAKERRVSPEEGRELARRRGCHYFETSAKEGTNIGRALSAALGLLSKENKA